MGLLCCVTIDVAEAYFLMCNKCCFTLPLPKDTPTKNQEELEHQASRLRVLPLSHTEHMKDFWAREWSKNHIQLLNHENVCSLLVPFIGIKINKQALNFSSSYHDMYMVKNSG